jgi:hypothetical protein
MLLQAPVHSRECAARDEKPVNCLAMHQTRSLSLQGKQKKNSPRLNDRSGNAYENKGRLWKTRRLSRNVYENKGGWPLEATMLLKRKEVFVAWR